MASPVDICNRALQKLGATPILSLSDASTSARACARCYDAVRQDELRDNPWNFAIKRFQLAATTAPVFGPANAYPLPTGWMRVLHPDPAQNLNDLDWVIEGASILTDMGAPLNVRCVMDVTDVNSMDASFREALASRMAREMAEQLTQSNEKKVACDADYKFIVARAKKTNAIEKVPQVPPEDSWITARA